MFLGAFNMTTYDPSDDHDKMQALARLATSIAEPIANIAVALTVEAEILERHSAACEHIAASTQLISHKARQLQDIAECLSNFAGGQPSRPQVFAVGAALADIEPLLKRLVGRRCSVGRRLRQ